MAATLTASAILQQRWEEDWLVAVEAKSFWSQLQQLQLRLQEQPYRDVMLVEADPVRFLAAFLTLCQQPRRVWLANPQWGAQEWRQVAQRCKPDLVVGTIPAAMRDVWGDRSIASPPSNGFTQTQTISDYPPPQILIPTGGSSGNLRFAVHTWDTLSASVQGFQRHFQAAKVNAYCVLPLFHVSGLMQALRCLLSGGKLIIQPFQTLLQVGAAIAPADNLFLSLVPTQLQRLLKCDRDFVPWLQQFTAILLGGAPPWPSLLQTARTLKLPLAPTYGMTETASQVATLLPTEFLIGNNSSGSTLPHARITIRDDTGHLLAPKQTGFISIEAASLAQGYEQTDFAIPFQTGDLGCLDEKGYLYVLGRQKTLILTGGEKVLPEEVEAAILATEMVRDAAVVGMPDDDWGEVVVAVLVGEADLEHEVAFQERRREQGKQREQLERRARQSVASQHGAHLSSEDSEIQNGFSDRLRQHLKLQLSPYKVPKYWLTCTSLPRNPQGKLNRTALREWVRQQLHHQPTVPATESAPASADSAAE